MRLLVTGANGQVGYELVRSLMPLGEVVALTRDDCDFASAEAIERIVDTHQPDVIVNAAAYTAVDRAESEEGLATTINGEAPAALARAAREAGALLLHYSTDYVFDGNKNTPWDEADPVSPLNAYGRSKLAGEQAIAASGADYIILRTTWVFAARGANFVRTMLRLGREREVLRVVADQFGAPTWARNIADASAHIVVGARRERAEGRFNSEILHLASQGSTSWHGFAAEIFAQYARLRPNAKLCVRAVEPILTLDFPTPARRPANSRLDCSHLADRFGIYLPDWQVALSHCLEEIIAE